MRGPCSALALAVCAASAAAQAATGPGVAPFGLGAFGRNEPIEITADKLEAQDGERGRRLAFERNVRVRQGPLGLSAQHIEATYPEGERQPDRLRARGDVRIHEGARRARCAEAHYDRLARRIVCTGSPAELWDGQDRLAGGVVTFDLATRSVQVAEGAWLEIQRERLEAESGVAADALGGDGGELLDRMRDGGPLTIRAASLEAHEAQGERRIAFDGDVRVRQGEIELDSGRLEVHYPPEATQPERLVAREQVVIREGRREARCERAEYNPAARRVSCEGDAHLRDAEDVFEGERIHFDFGTRRVEAVGRARLRVEPRAERRRP